MNETLMVLCWFNRLIAFVSLVYLGTETGKFLMTFIRKPGQLRQKTKYKAIIERANEAQKNLLHNTLIFGGLAVISHLSGIDASRLFFKGYFYVLTANYFIQLINLPWINRYGHFVFSILIFAFQVYHIYRIANAILLGNLA